MLTKNFKNEETKTFAYNLRYYNGYEKNVEDSIEVYRNVHRLQNLKSFECPDMYIELEDKVYRAFGLLTYASKLSSDETKKLLSDVKLGVDLGIIKEIDDGKMKKLELYTKAGNLQKYFGKTFDGYEREIKRAELVKQLVRE